MTATIILFGLATISPCQETEGDITIPFAECKKVLGCIHINTSAYDKPAKIEWKDEHTLYIDGRKREFSFEPLPDLEYTEEDFMADLESSMANESKTESSDTEENSETAEEE